MMDDFSVFKSMLKLPIDPSRLFSSGSADEAPESLGERVMFDSFFSEPLQRFVGKFGGINEFCTPPLSILLALWLLLLLLWPLLGLIGKPRWLPPPPPPPEPLCCCS